MAALKRKKDYSLISIICTLCIALLLLACSCNVQKSNTTTVLSAEEVIVMKLPEPRYSSHISLEQCLLERRSIREYSEEPISIQQISQLLWAAQGITHSAGFRTAPSAGGLYPLEVYAVVGNIEGLHAGIYHYIPDGHQITSIREGDHRQSIAEAALGQEWVLNGAVTFVITGIYQRTTEKYGDRGIRYVHIEAGHAAQNLLLQATVLDLGAVPVGAFHDDMIMSLLNLSEGEQPLYVIPVGRI